MSLMPIGRPCSGPNLSPRVTACSAVRAVGPRAIGDQCHDRVQRRIEAVDDREIGIENLDRAKLALAHERRELMGGFSPEIVHIECYSPTSTMAMTGPPPCGPWCIASTETKTAGSPIAAAATPPTAPFEWRW